MKQLLIGVVVGVACAGVVSSQTERFELEGNLKFFGTGNGIIFADGTTQVSAPVLMIGGGTIFDPGKTDYGALFGDSPWGLETESMTPVPLALAGTVSQFRVFLRRAPDVGESVVITLRRNGTSTNVACTVPGGTQTCSDTANSAGFAASDLMNIEVVTSGGITGGTMHWGARYVP